MDSELLQKIKSLVKVSSVLSFRNDSNGYYGGSLEECDNVQENGMHQITTENWQTK